MCDLSTQFIRNFHQIIRGPVAFFDTAGGGNQLSAFCRTQEGNLACAGYMKGPLPVGGHCGGKIRQGEDSAAHDVAGGIHVVWCKLHGTPRHSILHRFDDSAVFRGKTVILKKILNLLQSISDIHPEITIPFCNLFLLFFSALFAFWGCYLNCRHLVAYHDTIILSIKLKCVAIFVKISYNNKTINQIKKNYY